MLGIFLDTETNGLNVQIHRVIEIAFKILDLYTGKIVDQYQSIVFQPIEIWDKSDPASLHVNGFHWEDIKGGKKEQETAEEIIHYFTKHQIERKKAVFICQNPSFDRAFLSQIVPPDTQEALDLPYHWLDLASMFWAIAMKEAKQVKKENMFPWETGLSKDRIAARYNIPFEEKPHRAMNGVNHLIECYKAIVGFPYLEKKE